MPCYSPLKAYRPLSKVDGGRLVFNSKLALNADNPISIPCNNCIGCRIDRSRDWAVRCSHEASMHTENCFVSLTYSDDNLPSDGSVKKRELQLFFKKLRKKLGKKSLRYFACGEYGDENKRPHYHALIFGHDWPDKKIYSYNRQGQPLFVSEFLDETWGLGRCWSGSVSLQSAGYCARYALKKINGEKAVDHYTWLHPTQPKIVTVQPEFQLQSIGIGSSWYEKFKSDAFPSDFVVVDRVEYSVPRYYTRKLEEEEHTKIVRARKVKARPFKEHNTRPRLRVREEIKLSKLSTLKRDL